MQAEFVNFEELIRECDFILIACPMTAETNKMFSFDAFSKMKKKCTIINVGRGPVIDQEALYLALKNGQIFSAGLDVTDPEPLPADHPLLTLPNCGSFSFLFKSFYYLFIYLINNNNLKLFSYNSSLGISICQSERKYGDLSSLKCNSRACRRTNAFSSLLKFLMRQINLI